VFIRFRRPRPSEFGSSKLVHGTHSGRQLQAKATAPKTLPLARTTLCGGGVTLIVMGQFLGFVTGVGVSLVGVLVANILTRRRERRHVVEERRFEIFMKLMDLHSSYFWFTVAELHKEAVPAETRRVCHALAWQIADMLRAVDEVEFLEQTLAVTLGPTFGTAAERYEAMGRLIDQLGIKVNPRYAKKIREISEANIRLLGSGGSSNAPGAPGHSQT